MRVTEDDEILMMTARGKIQRIRASDISVIGRNTQGVRIMSLDDGDTLTAVVRVPKEESAESGDTPTDGSALGDGSESASEGAVAPPEPTAESDTGSDVEADEE